MKSKLPRTNICKVVSDTIKLKYKLKQSYIKLSVEIMCCLFKKLCRTAEH